MLLFKSFWKCKTVGYHVYQKIKLRHLSSFYSNFFSVTFVNILHTVQFVTRQAVVIAKCCLHQLPVIRKALSSSEIRIRSLKSSQLLQGVLEHLLVVSVLFFICFDIHSFPPFMSLLALFLVYQTRAMSNNQSGQCELRPGKQQVLANLWFMDWRKSLLSIFKKSVSIPHEEMF